jgi:hypothetical protein
MSRSTERELLINLENDIKERLEWDLAQGVFDGLSRDEVMDAMDDCRSEIVDSNLPIYYSDMAKLLAENTNFAHVDEESLLPENPSVWDIITMSVYEWLSSEYYSLLEAVLTEVKPELS